MELELIQINLLEDSDVIRPNDWVRQLQLTFTGQSDYLATNSTYGGSPINRVGWIPARYTCPYWVGKTVGEFRNKMLGLDRHAVEMTDYEFARGDIPKHHLERLTKEEIRLAEQTWKWTTENSRGVEE